MHNLSAKPVQLDLHKDICISFREDSFVVSFGDAKKFYEEDGKGAERYIEWLQGKINKDPLSAIHIWEENQIIGQIEMGGPFQDPTCGYINLYYLIPSKRGKGLGKFLDEHAMDYFKNKSMQKVHLRASPDNSQAVSYYKKMGWKDLGPSATSADVHLMEKIISP
nr:GNAT family N-acetyltransferase [Bacteriovorax sp. HI3]